MILFFAAVLHVVLCASAAREHGKLCVVLPCGDTLTFFRFRCRQLLANHGASLTVLQGPIPRTQIWACSEWTTPTIDKANSVNRVDYMFGIRRGRTASLVSVILQPLFENSLHLLSEQSKDMSFLIDHNYQICECMLPAGVIRNNVCLCFYGSISILGLR